MEFLKGGPLLPYFKRVAALIQCPTVMMVTSTDWRRFADELWKNHRGAFMDQTRPPTPENGFNSMNFHVGVHELLVINSGTESQAACDEKNAEYARKAQFRQFHDYAAIPAYEKVDPIEYTDAESTHEVPQDLAAETVEREIKKREQA